MFYKDYHAKIEHKGEITEYVEIETGVKQGCILLPTLFIIVIYWIMRNVEDGKTGLTWNMVKRTKRFRIR